jgi:hypothetical protein
MFGPNGFSTFTNDYSDCCGSFGVRDIYWAAGTRRFSLEHAAG